MPGYVEREYLDLSPLETRIQTHRLFSETASDIELNVIEAAALGPSESLLDVGSGTGSFLGRIRERGHAGRLCALDSSPRAVDACSAISGVEATLGDAQSLPFADAEFDVVTARHMLYHAAEPMAALHEARRVLRPGGRFAATVNHESVNPQMMGLLHDVLIRNGVTPPPSPDSLVHSGNLPSMAAEVFGAHAVRIRSVENALLFPAPEPIIRYLMTTLTLSGVEEDGPLRDAVARDIEAEVRARFARMNGVWRDPKGYIVCSATL